MGISCQRNEHWAATDHLSGRGLQGHDLIGHGEGVQEVAMHKLGN